MKELQGSGFRSAVDQDPFNDFSHHRRFFLIKYAEFMLLSMGHLMRTSSVYPYFAQLVVSHGLEKPLTRFCRGSKQPVWDWSSLASSNEMRGESKPAFCHPEEVCHIWYILEGGILAMAMTFPGPGLVPIVSITCYENSSWLYHSIHFPLSIYSPAAYIICTALFEVHNACFEHHLNLES